MNRRQFAVSTLLALVLLILVSIPMAHQENGDTYDPWLDYNEDGVIDANELYLIGQSYGTLGDPTKNVNVMNFPLDEEGNLLVTTADKPLQRYEDSMEIKLATDSENSYVAILTQYAIGADFPFAFSPKGESVNVTKMWIKFTVLDAANTGIITVYLMLNGGEPVTMNFRFEGVQVLASAEIEPRGYSTITPGINVLRMYDSVLGAIQTPMSFVGVSLYIEYEYLA